MRTTTSDRTNAFTLIEVVVSLVIMALLVSGGMMALRHVNPDERELDTAASELKTLARKAKRMARGLDVDHLLVFTENGVRLDRVGEIVDELAEDQTEKHEVVWPEGLSVQIDAPEVGHGSRRVSPVEGELAPAQGMKWRIPARGLAGARICRLSNASGWTEIRFHPLTVLPDSETGGAPER